MLVFWLSLRSPRGPDHRYKGRLLNRDVFSPCSYVKLSGGAGPVATAETVTHGRITSLAVGRIQRAMHPSPGWVNESETGGDGLVCTSFNESLNEGTNASAEEQK